MCGIIGYVGPRQAAPILITGLKMLEYRGYDSAGIAVLEAGNLNVTKRMGKIHALESMLNGSKPAGQTGIGHTRWATHGCPSDGNSHPHTDCNSEIAVVHNGIIENYWSLKKELEDQGHVFRSETDSEVLPHLIEQVYEGDLLAAVLKAIPRLEGSYAFAVMAAQEPNQLIAIRKDSPLVIGLGEGENFLASDIPALLSYTRNTLIMEDGEAAVLTAGGVQVYNAHTGRPASKQVFRIQWDLAAAEKGGYPHFMLKEIHEQPRALRDTLAGKVTPQGTVQLPEVNMSSDLVRDLRKVCIVACGTAYHAGLVGRYVMERLVGLSVEVDIASEFRYREPLVDAQSLMIVISQSGETADTLAALRTAKSKGARVIAVTNVVGSSVSREADYVVYTLAGPEIAVASTKAYATQLEAMYLLALFLGQARGTVSPEQAAKLTDALKDLPAMVEKVLEQEPLIERWARELTKWEDAFFIGRGLDYAVAMEGSLKLKEISYVHAEAYAAGELKHGTLALITEGVPVVALATQPGLYDKMVSNIKEVKARGAWVTAITFPDNGGISQAVDHVITLPPVHPMVATILAVVPLQLLAYYAAVARGCDVDKPRNLAKSVTVE